MERALPPGRRHQELHRGHLVELVHAEDRALVTPEAVRRFALCGTAAELRRRLAELSRDGVDEVLLQPGGDVPAELRRLAAALLDHGGPAPAVG
jgi:alkanesulfonate monooxygenase SsuD/methylene tetrahydromethanopterin reductase-like flavin-dependent oxidoreductase (luciferase family)